MVIARVAETVKAILNRVTAKVTEILTVKSIVTDILHSNRKSKINV